MYIYPMTSAVVHALTFHLLVLCQHVHTPGDASGSGAGGL